LINFLSLIIPLHKSALYQKNKDIGGAYFYTALRAGIVAEEFFFYIFAIWSQDYAKHPQR